jgi:hexosaminidase
MPECERVGRERVYLDFLKQIHQSVAANGRTMQFWGDIILHAPQLIEELPKDVIALEWGYEANHPFDEHCAAFAKSGVPHYVCPGTSSWLSIGGRTDNMIANLRSAAESGLKHGAIGYLNTDWGDLGHWQYLSTSYAGFAIGAAYAWCYDANRSLNLPRALDAHVFQDAAGVLGSLVLDLGNLYRVMGDEKRHNSTLLFWLLRKDEDRPTTLTNAALLADVHIEPFERAEAAIDSAVARASAARSARADAAIIQAELANSAALSRHACTIGRRLLKGDASTSIATPGPLLDAHRQLWLARNRVGGLQDSTRWFA